MNATALPVGQAPREGGPVCLPDPVWSLSPSDVATLEAAQRVLARVAWRLSVHAGPGVLCAAQLQATDGAWRDVGCATVVRNRPVPVATSVGLVALLEVS